MTLEPIDYWRLRTVSAELERDQATLVAIQVRVEGTRQRRLQLWTEIAAKYGLDVTGNYTARDEDCSLSAGT